MIHSNRFLQDRSRKAETERIAEESKLCSNEVYAHKALELNILRQKADAELENIQRQFGSLRDRITGRFNIDDEGDPIKSITALAGSISEELRHIEEFNSEIERLETEKRELASEILGKQRVKQVKDEIEMVSGGRTSLIERIKILEKINCNLEEKDSE
jgi:hypothetical protein